MGVTLNKTTIDQNVCRNAKPSTLIYEAVLQNETQVRLPTKFYRHRNIAYSLVGSPTPWSPKYVRWKYNMFVLFQQITKQTQGVTQWEREGGHR
jgi:hypothetical protein